jgi:hypothetical protein
MSNYHVVGTLRKESRDMRIDYFSVDQEIEAGSAKAAKDHFEENGWEWEAPPKILLITEAMKMARDGQPTLFPLGTGEW